MAKKTDANRDNTNGDFGAWLRKTRESKNMSVIELSELSGVSYAQIYNIESGRSLNPQEKTRNKLQNALQTEVPQGIINESAHSQDILGLGSLIDFDPHDENDLPQSYGVYVFYDISDRPVYVGRSTKQGIAKRVKQHYDKFWFKRPIVDRGAYVAIHEEKLCKQVEQILIKFLRSNAVLNSKLVEREPDDDENA